MIIISFDEVSLTPGAALDVTIGDAGGLETFGYVSAAHKINTTTPAATASTSEFVIPNSDTTHAFSGQMILTLQNASTFTWASSHSGKQSTSNTSYGGGIKSLAGEITQVSISGGTFDGGAVNVMYQ